MRAHVAARPADEEGGEEGGAPTPSRALDAPGRGAASALSAIDGAESAAGAATSAGLVQVDTRTDLTTGERVTTTTAGRELAGHALGTTAQAVVAKGEGEIEDMQFRWSLIPLRKFSTMCFGVAEIRVRLGQGNPRHRAAAADRRLGRVR